MLNSELIKLTNRMELPELDCNIITKVFDYIIDPTKVFDMDLEAKTFCDTMFSVGKDYRFTSLPKLDFDIKQIISIIAPQSISSHEAKRNIASCLYGVLNNDDIESDIRSLSYASKTIKVDSQCKNIIFSGVDTRPMARPVSPETYNEYESARLFNINDLISRMDNNEKISGSEYRHIFGLFFGHWIKKRYNSKNNIKLRQEIVSEILNSDDNNLILPTSTNNFIYPAKVKVSETMKTLAHFKNKDYINVNIFCKIREDVYQTNGDNKFAIVTIYGISFPEYKTTFGLTQCITNVLISYYNTLGFKKYIPPYEDDKFISFDISKLNLIKFVYDKILTELKQWDDFPEKDIFKITLRNISKFRDGIFAWTCISTDKIRLVSKKDKIYNRFEYQISSHFNASIEGNVIVKYPIGAPINTIYIVNDAKYTLLYDTTLTNEPNIITNELFWKKFCTFNLFSVNMIMCLSGSHDISTEKLRTLQNTLSNKNSVKCQDKLVHIDKILQSEIDEYGMQKYPHLTMQISMIKSFGPDYDEPRSVLSDNYDFVTSLNNKDFLGLNLTKLLCNATCDVITYKLGTRMFKKSIDSNLPINTLIPGIAASNTEERYHFSISKIMSNFQCDQSKSATQRFIIFLKFMTVLNNKLNNFTAAGKLALLMCIITIISDSTKHKFAISYLLTQLSNISDPIKMVKCFTDYIAMTRAARDIYSQVCQYNSNICEIFTSDDRSGIREAVQLNHLDSDFRYKLDMLMINGYLHSDAHKKEQTIMPIGRNMNVNVSNLIANYTHELEKLSVLVPIKNKSPLRYTIFNNCKVKKIITSFMDNIICDVPNDLEINILTTANEFSNAGKLFNNCVAGRISHNSDYSKYCRICKSDGVLFINVLHFTLVSKLNPNYNRCIELQLHVDFDKRRYNLKCSEINGMNNILNDIDCYDKEILNTLINQLELHYINRIQTFKNYADKNDIKIDSFIYRLNDWIVSRNGATNKRSLHVKLLDDAIKYNKEKTMEIHTKLIIDLTNELTYNYNKLFRLISNDKHARRVIRQSPVAGLLLPYNESIGEI